MTEDFRNTVAEIDDSNPVNTVDQIQKSHQTHPNHDSKKVDKFFFEILFSVPH